MGVIVGVVTVLIGLAGFLAAAYINPAGAWNGWVIGSIEHVSSYWPSTPTQFTIAGLATSINQVIPFGSGVIYEILDALMVMFSLMMIIKIYKLIPFKAT